MEWAEEVTGDSVACSYCDNVEKDYKTKCSEPHIFILHVNILQDIRGNKRENKKKREKIRAIGIILSALRNTEGGTLLVHLHQKADRDNFLGYFDECIEDTFKQLLSGGRTFTQCYSRKWLSEYPTLETYKDILVITVAKAIGVSTVDFKTKIASDLQLDKPSCFNILAILGTPSSHGVKAKLRGINPIPYESRNIQLKGFHPTKDESHCNAQDSPESFANFIWKTLRFREYLSSMSKLIEGGSFYLGITEKDYTFSAKLNTETKYKSKQPTACGFKLSVNQSQLYSCLLSIISSEIIIRNQKGDWINDISDLVEIGFYGDTDRTILEIAIGHVNGLLFYDKEGPEAYEVTQNGKPGRILKEDWFKRFKETLPHV